MWSGGGSQKRLNKFAPGLVRKCLLGEGSPEQVFLRLLPQKKEAADGTVSLSCEGKLG